MNHFAIGPIIAQQDGERTKVSAPISSPASIKELWFRTSGISPRSGEDILVPASLFYAMRAGLPLHIRGAISAKQANNLDSLQAIFNR
jgi:hypothetical protein